MRVGFFGLLGSGNLGNDASFEVVLRHLRARHPDVVIDALCMGPEQLTRDYGVPACRHLWYGRFDGRHRGVRAAALKSLGKGLDAVRTAAWVRRHDVVIVPGMGVLEATLPLRASGMPYALFLLSASGRLFGTKVALVNVGASPVNQRLMRWLSNGAARLASYRSYRDLASVQAMRRRGVAASREQVHPDLVFGLEAPEALPGGGRTVGVGLMAFYGDNDDRARAQEIYDRYIRAMQRLVRWLVETGHRVRLFWGDDVDAVAVRDVLRGWSGGRPVGTPDAVSTAAFRSLRGLMGEMADLDAVVATRYHNVLCALRLSKPTIAVGYSAKHDALMSDMGMPAEFSLPARAVDADRLVELFGRLERRSEELSRALAGRNRERALQVSAQLDGLSRSLLSREAPRPGRHDGVAGAVAPGAVGGRPA